MSILIPLLAGLLDALLRYLTQRSDTRAAILAEADKRSYDHLKNALEYLARGPDPTVRVRDGSPDLGLSCPDPGTQGNTPPSPL